MTFIDLYKEIKKLYKDAEIERDNAILFEKHCIVCMCVFYDKDFLGYELYERKIKPIVSFDLMNYYRRYNKDPQKILDIIKANYRCKQ